MSCRGMKYTCSLPQPDALSIYLEHAKKLIIFFHSLLKVRYSCLRIKQQFCLELVYAVLLPLYMPIAVSRVYL